MKSILCKNCLSVFVLMMALSGCGVSDPWEATKWTPPSTSTAFVPPEGVLSSAKKEAKMTSEAFRIEDKTLTLAECIGIALKRHPRTRRTWQSSLSSAARVGEEKSAYLPSVEFTSGAMRVDTVELKAKEDQGVSNIFDVGFGVRYLLFDGGTRSARVEAAEAELLAANFRHNTTLQEVALAVEETYYGFLAAEWNMKVAQETVKQTQYHVNLARARHESGVVARSDVLKAETERASAELFIVRARSLIKIAHGQLASEMGLRVSQPFKVADLPENARQQELADIERLLAEAAKGRPELQTALAQIEANRADIKAAESLYWPVVTGDVSYGWQDRTFMPDREQWFAGIGINLPLFTGFDRSYRIRRAKADLAGAVAEYENLLRGVELEVWTTYALVIEADQAIRAAEKLVANAEESARVAEGEYKNGTGFILELIDTQTSRTGARQSLVQVRFDWYTALARLERAVGRTLASKSAVTANGRISP